MKEVKVIFENKKQEAIAKGSCWCPWTSQTVMFINFQLSRKRKKGATPNVIKLSI